MPKISVIIKVRNESEFLERCLDSVFSSNLDSKSFEVIIVDSESEDGSLEIIKKFPVKLLKFDKKSLFSPPASVYLGLKHSSGDYQFVLDGDMLLDSDWLKFASEKLDIDNSLVMIAGNRPNLINSGKDTKLITPSYVEYGRDKIITGPFMIRRSFFDEYSPIDPFMKGSEEAYCSSVAIMNNHSLERFDRDMIIHLGYNKYTNNFKAVFNSGKYNMGIGQKLRRLFFKAPLSLSIGKDSRTIPIFIFFIILYLLFAVSFLEVIIIAEYYLFLFFTATNSFLFSIQCLRLQSIKMAFLSILSFYVKTYYFLKGLVTPVRDIDSFPSNFSIISYEK